MVEIKFLKGELKGEVRLIKLSRANRLKKKKIVEIVKKKEAKIIKKDK